LEAAKVELASKIAHIRLWHGTTGEDVTVRTQRRPFAAGPLTARLAVSEEAFAKTALGQANNARRKRSVGSSGDTFTLTVSDCREIPVVGWGVGGFVGKTSSRTNGRGFRQMGRCASRGRDAPPHSAGLAAVSPNMSATASPFLPRRDYSPQKGGFSHEPKKRKLRRKELFSSP